MIRSSPNTTILKPLHLYCGTRASHENDTANLSEKAAAQHLPTGTPQGQVGAGFRAQSSLASVFSAESVALVEGFPTSGTDTPQARLTNLVSRSSYYL
jgi:hypothetical protein